MAFDPETHSAIEAAQRQQRDISDFQIPRLRKCEGPLSVQQNIWVELRDDLDSFAAKVQEIDLLIHDQPGESARESLRAIARDLNEAFGQLTSQSRAALLDSKKVIDLNSNLRRHDLLRASAVTDTRSANEKTAEDVLMKKNQDLTTALSRTLDTMQSELSRSVLTTQMLESSTQTLKSTSETHDLLTSGLDTSKRLITALEKADWMDRLIVFAALSFFVLTVLFIVKQRVLDKGLKIAFWWTAWLPDFSSPDSQILLSSTITSSITSSAVISSIASSISSSPSILSVDTTLILDTTSSSTVDLSSTVLVDESTTVSSAQVTPTSSTGRDEL